MSITGSSKGFASSKLVPIGSSNAISGTSTNFVYNAGINLQQVYRVSILNVSFYNNFYNIYNDTRGSNTSYSYTYNGSPYQFNLVPGFYSVTQILNLMNANLV